MNTTHKEPCPHGSENRATENCATENCATSHPRHPSEGPLLLCALLLAVFLGVVLSPILNQPARAEMVAESDHLVVMTAKGGGSEDIFLVLDNRTEELTVYTISNQNTLDLVQRLELPDLFQAARAKRLGGN